ncbi:tryptophan synthase subunit alpha [Rarobacter faecitabidus]|uniref:tryptophan synthase subunit alpha n=1 Tax=Rarobacter faecitabidus TaxID=13243 RepID=UPI00115184D7|nr:tryptophan synthase subunit alpha [Rarobacter faecitabidus]
MLTTAARLDEIKASGRSALIGYLPTGFPTVDQSIEAARTLVENGVDILELGIPYTDPVMDGPTIQHAVDLALTNGVRVADTFRVMRALRDLDAPVLAMSYFNPLLQYGIERFAADLVASGGAGVITADLIPEEASEWIAAADRHGLDKVFLVAPSSTPQRLAITAEASRGFVYAASVMGVTGERTQVGNDAERLVRDTRAAGAARVCVGLGVSTRVQAAGIASYADGVIVGSAFVRPLLADKPWGERLEDLAAIAGELARGVAEGARDVVP